jgi:hypothetical protein
MTYSEKISRKHGVEVRALTLVHCIHSVSLSDSSAGKEVTPRGMQSYIEEFEKQRRASSLFPALPLHSQVLGVIGSSGFVSVFLLFRRVSVFGVFHTLP